MTSASQPLRKTLGSWLRIVGVSLFLGMVGAGTSIAAGVGGSSPSQAAAAVDTCGYPVGAVGLPSTVFNESLLSRWIQVNGSGLGATVSVFASDEHSILLGVTDAANPAATVTPFVTAGGATLTSALSGNGITSLPVTQPHNAVVAGETIEVGTKSVVAAAPGASATATSIPVNSFNAPGAGIPVGSLVELPSATTTSAALTGNNLTTVPVTALTAAMAAGSSVTIGTNPGAKTTTLTAAAGVGDTSLSVVSFNAPGGGFPIGTVVYNPIVYGSAPPPALALGDTTAADAAGRPYYPAIFVTDLTTNPLNANGEGDGDWQMGGTAQANLANVFGTWVVGSVAGVVYTQPPVDPPNANETATTWFLGAGSDVPTNAGGFVTINDANNGYATTPPGQNPVKGEDPYGTELRWTVSSLLDNNGNHLVPGHTYRFQVITHDGDQNKAGGDVGELCTSLSLPAAPSLTVAKTSSPASGSNVALGQTVTYTLTLSNSGNADATNVAVTDAIDAGTTYVAGSADHGGSLTGSTLSWTGLTVPAATGLTPGTLVLTFQVTVNANDTNGQELDNQGSFTDNANTPNCTADPNAPRHCLTNMTKLFVAIAPPPPPPPIRVLNQPTIGTSATQAALGSAISDTASLANATGATGTITFKAYGPADPNCAATPAFTTTVTVNGIGNYGPVSFTPTVAGTYLWIASYGGDGNNLAAAGTCGATGETSVVSATAPSGGTTTTTTTTTVPPTTTTTAAQPIVSATTVHTGKPWAGSTPYVVGFTVFGGSLVGLGLLQRRRSRSATQS